MLTRRIPVRVVGFWEGGGVRSSLWGISWVEGCVGMVGVTRGSRAVARGGGWRVFVRVLRRGVRRLREVGERKNGIDIVDRCGVDGYRVCWWFIWVA